MFDGNCFQPLLWCVNFKTMKDLLLKFRNEIRSKTRVGEYEELLALIEKEIDKLDAES